MASDSTDRLRWRCVACRSENHVSLRPARGSGRARRDVTGPFETACAHCRTRHILVGDPGELARVAPRDEIGRRGVGGPARVFLGGGLAATGALGLFIAAQAALQAGDRVAEGSLLWEGVAWAVLGLGALVAGALLLRGKRGAEAFLACEKGLEVRGPDGRPRGLIPWEKIRGAEYRLLMGRRMALWLAVEGPDGSVPPAPLVAETGVALFTRSRAMPQFLMALAGRLGDRVRFILPIVALGAGGGGRGVALGSALARRLVSGTLRGPELSERLFDASDV
ncbi:MAG: hypothetical protein ACYTKD_12165 [Planctomycetota bacterium]|jgi:hypothetical protein